MSYRKETRIDKVVRTSIHSQRSPFNVILQFLREVWHA